jgi:signal transduction histidine kinase
MRHIGPAEPKRRKFLQGILDRVRPRVPGPWARSIAARLLVVSTVLSFTILLVAGLALSAIYRRGAEARFDDALGAYLRVLVADIATPGEDSRTDPGQLGLPQFELVASGWYWQISRLGDGAPEIKSSRSLFTARLPRLSDHGIAAGLGGARAGTAKGPDERELRILERVIDVSDQGLYLVQVAATTADLDAEIARFEGGLAATFALLALALAGSSVLQVVYGLKPLRRLRAAVAAIRRGDAEKVGGAFPQEIAPLADELDLLVAANRTVVERARTQVGNLAHALKTPLSVIINEAARDRGPLAEKVEEQAAIMRDQVAHYLDRARAAVSAQGIGLATEVEPVIAALLRTFEKIYADRAVTFSASVAGSPRFQGERQDLEEMIGNLVDNAGKWARDRVVVTVAPDPPRGHGERAYFRVTIDDDGPGLEPELRATALERGRRLDETKPGSGLGLSIVADLATLYRGSLMLGMSPAGGLRAELILPAA